MPSFRPLRAAVLAPVLAALLVPPAAAGERNPTGWRLFSPCADNCAVAVFAGPHVDNSMADVLFKAPELPFTWDYRSDDHLVGVTFSRHAATLFGHVDLEPEIGLGQRLGRQDETEVWTALYARYRGFPWDHIVTTTIAASIGFSYASDVSEVEESRAGEAQGDRLLHYFSPEITFALPDRPDIELLFRFHHRSGVFGIVSDARGGAHYGTVGLRFRF